MLDRLEFSLTKFGAIELIDIIRDRELKNYLEGLYQPERVMDKPQVKAILGMENFNSIDIPPFWDVVCEYPETIIGAFVVVAYIFGHHQLISKFIAASEVSNQTMRGVLVSSQFSGTEVKVFTNLRSLLVHAKVSPSSCEKESSVPYDFSSICTDGDIGPLVKQLLQNRLKKVGWNRAAGSEYSEVVRNFEEQCINYSFHRVLNLSEEEFLQWLKGSPVNSSSLVSQEFPSNLTKRVEVDTNLLLSLAAKPFLILTGPSGTGKTLGIRQLAASISPGGHVDNNMTFIAVEAGWKDGKHLIGYKNPFGEHGEYYQPSPLIEMLLKASSTSNRDIPFFAIFDEMNLSHVEMYFARFLSLLETSRHPGINRIPLLSVEDLQLLLKYYQKDYLYSMYILEAIEQGGLYFYNNVFFIGTVNIDETTYMFSPKVLDRAFVIEKHTNLPSSLINNALLPVEQMFDLTISDINEYLLGEDRWTNYQSGLLGTSGYTVLTSQGGTRSPMHHETMEFLDEVYVMLEDFPFGYRTVVESNTYVLKAFCLNQEYGVTNPWLTSLNNLHDEILMQKILPKIHGNKKQLSSLLSNLISFCQHQGMARFPKSLKKLSAMEKSLKASGYCGFIG